MIERMAGIRALMSTRQLLGALILATAADVIPIGQVLDAGNVFMTMTGERESCADARGGFIGEDIRDVPPERVDGGEHVCVAEDIEAALGAG